MDTSTSNLLLAGVSQYSGATIGTLSDSNGNTWVPLTVTSGSIAYCRLFYCIGGTVGAAHTFTWNGSGVAGCLAIQAWKAPTTPSFDVGKESGALVNSGTTVQPGSLTPSVGGALIVTGMSDTDGTVGPETVDSGFAITDSLPWNSGNYEGFSLAYLVQTSAAPVNPTWTWFNSGQSAARMAVFKP